MQTEEPLPWGNPKVEVIEHEDGLLEPVRQKPTTKEELKASINDMFTKKLVFVNGGVTKIMETLREATNGRTTSISQFNKEELENLWDIVNNA